MPEDCPLLSISTCIFTSLHPHRNDGARKGPAQGLPRSAASSRGSGLALRRKEGVLQPEMEPGQEGQAPGAQGAAGSYRMDPVDVVGDAGEDRGLVVVVAAQGGPEADHAVHLPLAVGLLAVQGSSGVSLGKARLCQEGLAAWAGAGKGRGCP